ncbi:MAG: hypothetical protein AB8F26_13075 [Phycisphaerales bacterium]
MTRIKLTPAAQPIRDPVTKFGGDPVWVGKPAWPLSRSTGRPMRFVCQVALDPDKFGARTMAYLFMTDPEPGQEFVDGTWEPYGGENAVVLGPGSFESHVELSDLRTGPTLFTVSAVEPGFIGRLLKHPRRTVAQPIEFGIQEIPDSGEEFEIGTKLEGEPDWLQNEEPPIGTGWHLVAQIDPDGEQSVINFGDAGVGYMFVNEDGQRGHFLWQCC